MQNEVTHKLIIEASDPQIIQSLVKAQQAQIIAASLPFQESNNNSLQNILVTDKQGTNDLHPLTIPLTIFCIIGSGLLITPQGNKIWDSLPAIKSWQEFVNNKENKSTKTTTNKNQITNKLIFPLAGFSGQTKLAGSIPGDCRPLGRCDYKHAGADYGAAPGTPVLSIEDGTINELKPDSAVGGVIGIKSKNKNEIYRYVHLNRDYLRQFKIGQSVAKGSVIGLVGPTFAGSSAPHLHLERYENGSLDWLVHKKFEKAVQANTP